MFINKIIVKNFRRFDEHGIEICFNSGINIVLGENNIGKSAIIDAIRLALSSGQYRKSLYLTSDDFHIDKYGRRTEQINIDLYFEELSDEQASAFYLLTDGTDTSKAELHVQYQLQK
jgi:putative ATP-dependent endonuclease of OLD family